MLSDITDITCSSRETVRVNACKHEHFSLKGAEAAQSYATARAGPKVQKREHTRERIGEQSVVLLVDEKERAAVIEAESDRLVQVVQHVAPAAQRGDQLQRRERDALCGQ